LDQGRGKSGLSDYEWSALSFVFFALICSLFCLRSFAYAEAPGAGPIIVGAKPFPEGHLLAEILATLIEQNTTRPVVRKFELGGTNICFAALQEGEIDMYPEYTGTGLIAILKEPAQRDPEATYQHVQRAFLERYQLRWLEPFGFNNTYALAVRG